MRAKRKLKDLVSANASRLLNLVALAAGTSLMLGIAAPSKVLAGTVNIHPADCVAPFLSQAQRLRWHEQYLINPADSQNTWVVCPVTFDITSLPFTSGGGTSAVFAGAVQPGASSDAPLCFFAAAEYRNLQQLPYIDIPGGARKFVSSMSTNKTPPTWVAQGFFSNDNITAALGGSSSPAIRNVAVFCQLPPGHSISLIQVNGS